MLVGSDLFPSNNFLNYIPSILSKEATNAGAVTYRNQAGMMGKDVQAGHTAAARHAPESGLSPQLMNDPATFQELHSRKGKGLDVTTQDKMGNVKTTTRHRVQEGLIDDGVQRVKKANAGLLTPQGHLDAAAEVRWRTANVPLDQRNVELIRRSVAANAVSEVAEKGGKTAIKVIGGKALKVIPFIGVGAALYSAQQEFRRGNYGSAALDLVGIVPVVGDVVDAARLGTAIGEEISRRL